MTDLPAPPDEFSALSGFSSELASMFVLLAGDIALVIGQDGVIQNVAVGSNIADSAANAWVGSHWAETVTGDTRRKVELLMQEVQSASVTKRRQVNLRASDGTSIPVSYAALQLGKQGPVIAVGRDLRSVAAIQQQMIKTQQEMERSYWTLRRDQDHQRELEQVASDAVLVVAGANLEVLKHNEAAEIHLLQADGATCPQLQSLLTQALQTGRAVEVRARLKSKGLESPLLDLFVTPFLGPEGNAAATRVQVRARPVGQVHKMPTEFRTAITDTQGKVLMASDALIAMCANAYPEGIFGQSLGSVLDGSQGILSGLLREVLTEGLAHHPSTMIGGRVAPAYQVEVSASLIAGGEKERVGFCFHVQATDDVDTWAQSMETILASQQPLSALLQDVQQLAERRIIIDALRGTSANVALSAKLLGISAQDLLQRLERLGLDHAQYTAH